MNKNEHAVYEIDLSQMRDQEVQVQNGGMEMGMGTGQFQNIHPCPHRGGACPVRASPTCPNCHKAQNRAEQHAWFGIGGRVVQEETKRMVKADRQVWPEVNAAQTR